MTSGLDREHHEPARRLGTADAVVIGISAMVGAGLFGATAPAAAAAGPWLLLGLAIAAVVAYCNAASTTQLAVQLPTSGGAYAYGRALLGPWAGFVAGWCFVIGKTASCAAMATVFAAYVAPVGWQRPVAAAAVLALTAVTAVGVTRTAAVARWVVAAVLTLLAVVLLGGLVAGGPSAAVLAGSGGEVTAYGVLQSAGLLFFAFAGYARMATLGEEVRDPARTLPRAVPLALGVVVAVYATVALTLLAVLGPARLATSPDPLAVLAEASWGWTAPLARVAATLAALGALLALLAGVGRTMRAMARERDLPGALAPLHPVHLVPRRAQVALGAVVTVLVLVADLRDAIGFSSFGVLLYYLVANLAALAQPPEHRRFARGVSVVGVVGCVVLVATLPVTAVVGGVVVVALGVVSRAVRLRADRRG